MIRNFCKLQSHQAALNTRFVISQPFATFTNDQKPPNSDKTYPSDSNWTKPPTSFLGGGKKDVKAGGKKPVLFQKKEHTKQEKSEDNEIKPISKEPLDSKEPFDSKEPATFYPPKLPKVAPELYKELKSAED